MGKIGGLGLDEIVNVYLYDIDDFDPEKVIAFFVVEFNSGLEKELKFQYDDDFWGVDMHGFSKSVLRFVMRYFDQHSTLPSRITLEQEFQ